MLVKVYGGAVYGINAVTITIEVNILIGAKFVLVGLPDNAIRESQQRIDSALREMGLRIPGKRVVINMAPANLRKEGTGFDLPLAIGILSANGQVPDDALHRYLLVGELSLDGTLLPVKGVLPIAMHAAREGFRGVVVPVENANEAAVIDQLEVMGFHHLQEVIAFFRKEKMVAPFRYAPEENRLCGTNMPDFSEVKGQERLKRALEIAAAGNHNLLMAGPPGSGKTMLAHRLPGILPPMSLNESLETTQIHSVACKEGLRSGLIRQRPFRAPHHTITRTALVGGGSWPQPGEISLAHHGVLYLDELAEFNRDTLELLRQPLEERRISISRSRYAVDYPANILLLASMNPCPCGYYNHPTKECSCSPGMVKKYLSRISGPLLDRIDIHIEVVPVPVGELAGLGAGEPSAVIRQRVVRARERQAERFGGDPDIRCNAQISPALLRKTVILDADCRLLLKAAIQRFGLSARAYDKICKLALTIADLAGEDSIRAEHIAEAIRYRSIDCQRWR